MCIVFFGFGMSEDLPFVLASNRDEFWSRPTVPMHWWDEEQASADAKASSGPNGTPTTIRILAGRDLRQGGTWLAIQSNTHRLAVVTNYREPTPPNQGQLLSRGKLVTDFMSYQSMDEFMAHLQQTSHLYAGFNLLFGSPPTGYYVYSNRSCHQTGCRRLRPGQIYGMSNGLFDDEGWPKLVRGKRVFAQALQSAISNNSHVTTTTTTTTTTKTEHNKDNNQTSTQSLQEALWQVLTDEWKPPVEQLPSTGVSLALEKILSSIFVQAKVEFDYGTRCSTLVWQTAAANDGACWEVRERTYQPRAHNDDRRVYPQTEFESRAFRL